MISIKYCLVRAGSFLITVYVVGWLCTSGFQINQIYGQDSPPPSSTPAPVLTPVPADLELPTAMPLEMGPDPPHPLTSPDPIRFFSNAWGQVQQLGNIHYADILLDGHPVIQVAAPVPEPDQAGETLPIEIRVERIQNTLYRVIQTDIHPDQLEIVIGILNNQTVLLASEKPQGQQQFLLTITALDAQLARMEVPALAQLWKQRIAEALTQAWRERQPDYLWRQVWQAAQILIVALAIGLGFSWLQRLFKQQWLSLIEPGSMGSISISSDNGDETAVAYDDMPPIPGECTEASRTKTVSMSQAEPFLSGFSWKHPSVNVLIRRILVWSQIVLWFSALVWILHLFPHTREYSNDLLGIPIRVLGIWLVLSLGNRVVDVVIDQGVKAWVEENTVRSRGSQRYLQRAPTLATALKGMTDVLVVPLGVIWILYELQVPIAQALTGAGVVGLILTFSAQNLIKDLVNGFLILLEDQYALGDWVRIDGELGLVEYLDIRITKIRTPNGGLVTFPNGSLTKVENLSSDWARVNFEIDIAYDSDVDKAMQIMVQVAQTLYDDPDWHTRIIEPPQLLGIDHLAHHGAKVRLWIKTQRLEHWGVLREYSRRLRLALQANDISIGIPQESIALRTRPDSVDLNPSPSLTPNTDPPTAHQSPDVPAN